MPPAIRVENLGKSYLVNHAEERLPYKTMRDSLARIASAPLRRWKSGGHGGVVEKFWALKDITVDVQPGDVVGIVGRNGAGKSTLLKILSRITKPTKGRVTLHGRVGSLLEVGTGFHPELTGRENIYMNGSILGMSRDEISRKFDEIVDFSGIETFLDTPVKRYSSGMQVRLAFAVAAHLEPEILIIDEVLAVGDAEFQKKCIWKMQDVAHGGRTILFVSHNMAAIESLCTSAIEMNYGAIVFTGKTEDVVSHYHKNAFSSMQDVAQLSFRKSKWIKDAAVLNESGVPTNYIPLGGRLHVRLRVVPHHPLRNPTIGIGINAIGGQRMLTVHTPANRAGIGSIDSECDVSCSIDRFPLAPGEYSLKIALAEFEEELDIIEDVVPFTIVNGEAFGEGRGASRGVCIAPSQWWRESS